jgi:amino acid adenylation domain-containing protein
MSDRPSVFAARTVVELLRQRALEDAAQRGYAFFDDDGGEIGLSYRDLDYKACAIAALLQENVNPGQRVLLLYPPGLEFVAAFFGCLYAGVVAVPAYPPQSSRAFPRLAAIAEDARPALALTTTGLLQKLSALRTEGVGLGALPCRTTDDLPLSRAAEWQPPELTPESLAFLQYTSGSTALPKGVMVSHGNLLHNQEMIRRAFGQSRDSVIVGWLPLYHDMGLIGNVLQPLYVGARCILMSPLAFLQQPLRWLHAISRFRGTTSGGPNFAYDLCARKVRAEQLAELDLSSWEVAFNGAETVRPETLERFARTFAPCGFRREAFFPCYGLAEATLFVSGGAKGRLPRVERFAARELEEGRIVASIASIASGAGPETAAGAARELVSCGAASLGQRLVIVDPETGVPCPPDRVGEIWVSGPSVAQGYYRRAAATERDFAARLGEDGPFLRTGDLGFLADGELFVTGRLKDLIILRGRNLYPQDVELAAEQSHPALRPGCGAAFAVEVEGAERLVVVQEVDRSFKGEVAPLADAIRRAVAEEYEAQAYAVVLLRAGSIPKTSSGKIQRHACRKLFLEGGLDALGGSTLEAPEAEAPTAAAQDLLPWLREEVARLAGIPAIAVGPDQPLLALGLDSLAAVELRHRVEERSGVVLSLARLLEGQTLGEVAAEVLALADKAGAGEPDRAGLAHQGEELGEHPLSRGQRALWFLDRLAPESAAYNIAAAFRLRAAVDHAALERALLRLARRHPMLRAAFRSAGGEPVQEVLAERALEFAVEPAAGWSDRELARRLEQEACRPFDLQREPLLRLALFTRSADDTVALLVVHHIVADLWSLAVLERDLAAFYRQELGLPAAAPEPLALRYTDYVRWQDRQLAGEEGERLWSYWRDRLAGELPVLDLPVDRPRPPYQTFRGGSEARFLGTGLRARLETLGRSAGATLFTTLLAAWNALLLRYTGQDDLLVGSPTDGRDRPELAELVGYFVNPVVLRSDLAGDPGFAELLLRVRRTAAAAFEHRAYPFPLLVERLRPNRDADRAPVFQTLFAFERSRRGAGADLGAFALGEAGAAAELLGMPAESVPLAQRSAQFELELVAAAVGERIGLSLRYNADLFDGTTAARLLAGLQNLLEAVAAEASRPLSDLPLWSAAERHQALSEWNDTAAAREPSAAAVHRLFERQVERAPGAKALVAGSDELTYGELNARANRLARHLRRQGVGPETPVAVCLARGADLVVALLGVLKAGGAYVPIDPAYPEERQRFLLADSGAAIVLTRERLDAAAAETAHESALDLPGELSPRSLAYLIYTSGSTGRPKGVAIEHRSALALLDWARSAFAPADLAAVLAATSVCFDLSVFELFVPLSWGGSVRLVDNALALLRESAQGLTLINTVPSAMAELVRAGVVPASVRTVNLAGEPLPGTLVERIHALGTVSRVWNLYGPSEDTTYSTGAIIPRGAAVPSVGRPLSGTRAYLVDRRWRPVPLGVPGELLLAGAGLARGYHGRPDLTAERFLPDPFGDEPGARLYRTGDLARHRPDGELEFLGRLDHQVKVRGFRIELGEVETALNAHPAVEQAVVGTFAYGPDDVRLVAWVERAAGRVVEGGELRAWLQERLPEFMVPGAVVTLAALPRNANGKIDRQALPAPVRTAGAAAVPSAAGPTGPTGPIVELLAGIWAEVLRVPAVGPGDDFFNLGGHSLLATQVVSRVDDALGVDLPLQSLFAHPTLGALAAQVERMRGDGGGARALPPLVPQPGPAVASFAQERLWFLHRLAPGSPAYNMAGSVRLAGQLDPAALAAALAEVVRRHEVLRTTFREEAGEPVPVVAPADVDPVALLPVVDLRGPDADRRADEIAAEEARRPFDLAGGPLLRARLLRLAEDEHRLLLTLHHVVADGWSQAVLVREVSELYTAFLRGQASPLPELPLQYADFARWQRGWLQGELLDRQLAYWQAQLAGELPPLELPTDRPRPAIASDRGARRPAHLPAELTAALSTVARRQGATLYMVLLAGFETLLHLYTGQTDFAVGSPIANRTRSGLEGLIGFFVNTLVLRADLSGEPTFAALVGRVRETTLAAYAHQDLPFERLVDLLQPDRDRSRSPLFQALFTLQNVPLPALSLPDLSAELSEVDNGTAKFDLTLSLAEAEGGLAGTLEYAADLFDPETADRLLRHFAALLAGAAADPARPLAELPLLTDADREELLHRRSALSRPRPPRPERPVPAPAPAGPRNPVEERIAALWREVLGVERVGIDDSFFALGGHSFLATRLASRIASDFAVDLPLSAILDEPTVAQIAARVAAARSAEQPSAVPPLRRVPRDGALPLSFAQERLWIMDRLNPGNAVYNVFHALRLEGPLDAAALGEAFAEVARRHEVLHTSFTAVKGTPVQVVVPGRPVVLATEDLRGLPAQEQERKVRERALAEARRPFDLEADPLLRVRLLTLGPDDHALLLTLHHIVCDDGSVGVLLWEVAEIYQAQSAGRAASLPELPVQYADYAVWQREWLQGEALAEKLAYWQEHLAGDLPVLRLPGDRPRPAAQTFRGATRHLALPAPLSAAVRAWSVAQGNTLFLTLLAAYAAVLHRASGQDDLVVGCAAANRSRVELEGLIGFFVNILPLRFDLKGDPTYGELLRRVRGVALAGFAHQDLPFEQMVAAVQPKRDLGHAALRQVGFAFENTARAVELAPGIAGRPIEIETGAARLDMTLFLWEAGGQIRGMCEYSTDLFDAATIERFLSFFERLLADMTADPGRPLLALPPLVEPAALAAPAETVSPRAGSNLTESQLLFWFAHELNPEIQLYFDLATTTFTMAGEIDPEHFSRAFQKLVDHADSLRSTIETRGGMPFRAVREHLQALVDLVDLSGAADPEAAYQAWLDARCRVRLDLGSRLFDCALVRVRPGRTVWFWNVHHIIADAWSIAKIAQTVSLYYQLSREGRLDSAAPLPSYQAYVEHERRLCELPIYERARRYWAKKLAAPLARNTFYRRDPAQRSTRTARTTVALGAERSAALHARVEGDHLFSPAVVFATVIFSLLHRLSGERTLRLGTPFANRSEAFADVVGLQMNACPIQVEVAAGETFLSLARKIQGETVETARFQFFPVKNPVQDPVYDVYFNYQNVAFTELCGLPVVFDLIQTDHSNDLFDLQVSDFTGSGRFTLDFDLNLEAFGPAERQRTVGHFLRLLEAFLENGETPLSEVDLLAPEERQELLVDFNRTTVDYAEPRRIHQLIAAQAERTPEAPALLFAGQRISYRDLDRRANQLAHLLGELGVGPDVRVGIAVERSVEMVVGLLGILKAGGAYVPLDPEYPEERLAFMMEDSRVPVLLTQGHLAGRLPAGPRVVLRLDQEQAEIGRRPDHDPRVEVGDANLAYVIYTSGSTGRPKGVMVPHGGIRNRLLWMQEAYGLSAEDRVLQKTPFSFDVSVWEFFWPLMTGATLVVALPGGHQDPAYLARTIGEERITTLHFVPSMLQAFLAQPDLASCRSLARVIASGEALSDALRQRFFERLPGELHNLYGPTEASVDVTAWACGPENGSASVPIGRPIANTQIHLLDPGANLVPRGIPGELAIGGVGLARGYLGRPDLTAERFIPGPFRAASEPGARLYRTGDLARHLPDGSIEFLGRLDHQVKLRGFRIELGEIEAALALHPGVAEAVVMAREDRPGDPRLVGYVVGEPAAAAPTLPDLRAFLAGRLPEHMLPAAVVVLPALPQNANGKVDRRALPAPDLAAQATGRDYVAPRGALEALLASIWAEVLGVERVSVEDSFFDLGGNSLMATQVATLVQEVLPVKLPLRNVFEAPTVAGIAKLVERSARGLTNEEQEAMAEVLSEFEQIMAGQEDDLPLPDPTATDAVWPATSPMG